MPSRPPPRPVHRAIRSVCRSRTVTPASFITSATPIPSSPRSRNLLAATLTIRSCVVCLSLFECPISIGQLYYKSNLLFGYRSGLNDSILPWCPQSRRTPGDELVAIRNSHFGRVWAEPSAYAQQALSCKGILEALFPET